VAAGCIGSARCAVPMFWREFLWEGREKPSVMKSALAWCGLATAQAADAAGLLQPGTRHAASASSSGRRANLSPRIGAALRHQPEPSSAAQRPQPCRQAGRP
jgi:hypothetical protein